MKIYAALGLAAMIAGLGATGAHAQSSIYVYNFNDTTGTAPATGADQGPLFSVDRVNQGAPAGGSALSTSFAAANVVNFAGTTVNADNGDVAGQALALQGGGATGAITNNGAYLQATANLTGFQNIGFSFAGQKTASGFSNNTLSYSLNGGQTFTTFASAINLPTAFAAQTFDFSGVTGLNNNANAIFRLTFDGATTATGNNRLDNLIISGTTLGGTPIVAPVPEASTTVSLGLMLALGGLAFAVKKKKSSVAL